MTDAQADSAVTESIAIVGMAGRFPGARSVAEFWRNQLAGIESISHFRDVPPNEVQKSDAAAGVRQVYARSVIDEIEHFDAEFFGIYPREAELMDPQQRLFLECCWEALENGGYVPDSYPGMIGVYAGCSLSSYFLSRLCATPGFIEKFTAGYQVSNYVEMMGNSLDFLSTRVSYKLNLRGPSFTLLSACSTSLLSVTQACQALLTYQTDMALAGGVSITLPQERGYPYQDGGMVSPDGHCRAFDAAAQGTVFGSGVGVVLLKRLDDALRDGDQVHSIIRGFAVNNDGSAKVGYTAPSVEGQAAVIAMAHQAAGVDPDTIGYIEAHGTGTPMGDPIELAALTRAFRASTERRQFCTIGTAKTNVGHLDIAAGITGLINASHIVKHGVFPPTLHFKRPNPKCDLESSPFRVETARSEWKNDQGPRRAGVSAFGVGGTNAHLVLEQAPARAEVPATKSSHLLVLSARSLTALERATDNLAEHLRSNPELNIADVAWTLQEGRREFDHRRIVVAGKVDEAVQMLSKREKVQTRSRSGEAPEIYFMFPGQGSQHVDMAREIYESEPVFRTAVDRCAEILHPHLGVDLRTLLYPPAGAGEDARRAVSDTIIAQPAIFTIEYGLAQLWMSWGIRPKAMVGHSVGEFVAACLAGVMSLEDALNLVALRGRMMQQLPAGGMLSVRLPEASLREILREPLCIAAINSQSLCVVAGPFDALARFESELEDKKVVCRRLVTSHAFHSSMMEPLINPLAAAFAKIKISSPQIPYISGVTGDWITDDEATDPLYWARHARDPVRFASAVELMRRNPDAILLEVGPGNVLATLSRQKPGGSNNQVIVSSLSDGFSGERDSEALLSAVGAVWLGGGRPHWKSMLNGEHRQRVALPTYPFERKRYWLEVAPDASDKSIPIAALSPTTSPSYIVNSQSGQEAEVANMAPNIKSQSVSNSRENRRAKIQAALADVLHELSGLDVGSADETATFLELGFDSLFLTQVAQALQQKFEIKITFRQLLNDISSLAALTDYVEGKLPQEMYAEPLHAPSHAPAVAPEGAIGTPSAPIRVTQVVSAELQERSPVAENTLAQLMREQLQAMNELFTKQLETMQAKVSGPSVSSAGTLIAPARPARSAEPVVASPQVTSPVSVSKPHGPYKPPQVGTSLDLTDQQQSHLARLIERVTRRTAKSKGLTQQYRNVLADPRVVSGFRDRWKEMVYPIVTDRSKGPRIWDIDGNEYIDLVNGFGPIMLGHRPDFVEKAIEAQLHAGFETGPQSALAGEVAKMFCDMTGNERMAFCNTGSEAVLAALRVARTVTGRSKVVMFNGDYHGLFDEVLVKGIRDRAGEPVAVPIAPGIPRQNTSSMVVLDYGTEEAIDWIRKNADDLAAVLIEPVQSRHPALQPTKFLKDIREITAASGTAMIFDEVVTGFRVHPGGCQALFGIRADLVTYGKVIAGGMPVGVLAGTRRFMDALDGGAWQFGDESYPEVGVTFFAGTFVRHPLVVAAMHAVLVHLRDQGAVLQERLNERTADLVQRLNKVLKLERVPTQIESFGSFFYFSFAASERLASLYYFYLRDKGIHIREGFPCFLTTSHSDADLDLIVRAFRDSAVEMRQAGFFSDVAGSPFSVAVPAKSPNVGPKEQEPIQLTEAQREIFLATVLGSDASCAFNESFSIGLRGELQIEALREAVNELIARHEALRATVESDGRLMHVKPKLGLEIPIRDLASLEPSEREAEHSRILAADARVPFDLINGPLIRAEVVRFEPSYHRLAITSHHIVCDGWSTNVLVDELATLYSAKIEDRIPDLPELVGFGQYARAQHELESSGKNRDVEAYWVSRFRELPEQLALPIDRPRSSVKTHAGATARYQIDIDTYRKIKQMGARSSCTLFATLLAGFYVLLHRLSGQSDIVVGVPAAGQNLADTGSLVGHCVNFLPLRAQLDPDSSFSQALSHTKQLLLDAYDHQSYTYGTLIRKLGVPRDPARMPLMDVQFNLERLGAGARFAGLETVVEPNPKASVILDLFFNVIESDRGLVIDCDYNSDLFDEATISQWMEYYKAILLDASSGADKAIGYLALMNEEQVSSILAKLNPNPIEVAPTRTIVETFERRATLSPDKVAVQIGEKRLTYRELNVRANQLARYLRRIGVQPSSRVMTSFERSIDMVVAMLAILKTGAAYVPLDSSYPLERLSMLVEDAKPTVLLTQQSLAAGLPTTPARIICLDNDGPDIGREDVENLPAYCAPDIPAYVIYTSGSTGKPKGVVISHHNVVRLLESTRNWFNFGETDVWTLFHSSSFDFSVWEIWGCLLTGGRLVIVPYLVTRSPQDFYNLLAEEQVTILNQTPAAFYQLIQVEEAGFVKPLSLRYVIFGGEALNFASLRPWVERHGDQSPRLVNMYGITETTVHVTYRPLNKDDIFSEARSLIGTPIPDLRLYVLDAKQRPVPPGVIGEIYVGGAGVANGYLNLPELSAERFVPDPFSKTPNRRMYKSGDLAKVLSTGDIEYIGRADNQLKIRGFRIEAGEIEAALAEHPAVQQAVVVARKDDGGSPKIIAYYVAKEGDPIAPAELREHLQNKLPPHMIPHALMAIDSVPLTINGKVDQKRLPTPESGSAFQSRNYVAPTSPQELSLAGIVREILKIEKIGITDNWFELGADSLHVFQITSRAVKAGLPITPKLVLQQRTISRILAELSQNQPAAQAQVITPLARDMYRVKREIVRGRKAHD
ncbi:amino acid adenylation domain-containing protein [Bradyrhizobium sp. CIAT3101]|uniref:non-ribosomal peptide synthetase/type I polyketide synthase n=1 Tax=Bradyrhizobium sp. CIAT3101 TaxID=439387 RepID=UPI0024B0D559|nr:non-ribosomal peptide synthetase/type I polyketide synthase [Bradyrhizobium sp. CIAT3101]WFU79136.1 amino acid adenylation domain-containing protein [Bradyrhizobium sp. CIAT3101]